MNTLEKAMTQTELTPDAIEAQFCSDWLKDQILALFVKNKLLEDKINDLPTKDEMADVSIQKADLEEKLRAYELLLEESVTGRIMLFEQLQEAKEDAIKFGRAMEVERNEKHFLSVELEIVRGDRNKLRDGIKDIKEGFADLVKGYSDNGDFYTFIADAISERLGKLEDV